MNKKTILMGSIIIFSILATSGCLEYFYTNGGNTIYESHPTKISYTISYGYKVNCTGHGDYNIKYDCDKPEVLIGTVTITDLLYDQDHSEITLANNNMIGWNISGKDIDNYELGIVAIVEIEGFLVSDLSGTGAETLQGLQNNHMDLVNQYCHKQSNETITFIDPKNPLIKNTAVTVKNQAKSNNSFILAKELFIWLKQHTNYQTHIGDNNIQPSSITLQKETGDCDDLSFLYISLCRSIDIPARFIRGYLAEENGDRVSVISHAWAEVFVGGELGNYGWIPVECAGDSDTKTEINQNFGVEDVSHLRLFEDDGSDESFNESISGIMTYYTKGMKVDMYSFVDISKYSTLESKELCIDENNNRAYI